MLKIFLVIILTTVVVFSTDSLTESEVNEENIISLAQQESKDEIQIENEEEAGNVEEIIPEVEEFNEVIVKEPIVVEKKEEKTSKKSESVITQKQAANTPKEEKKSVANESKNENSSNKANNSVTEKTNTNKPVKKEEKKTNNIDTTEVNTSYKEYEVIIVQKKQCDGNNHKITSGNTGKWFDTQAQADNYYNQELEKWGKKWETGAIKKDEYLEKCPSGYETWSCPQCQKWTLNFYYR